MFILPARTYPRDIPIIARPSCSGSLIISWPFGGNCATTYCQRSSPAQCHSYALPVSSSPIMSMPLTTHIKAKPTTQITHALIPCATRARAMTQNVGASMSITCEPIRAAWPNSNGIFLFLYFSDRNAIGGVTEPPTSVPIHPKYMKQTGLTYHERCRLGNE